MERKGRSVDSQIGEGGKRGGGKQGWNGTGVRRLLHSTHDVLFAWPKTVVEDVHVCASGDEPGRADRP